jgi:hypothetical protein
MRHFMAENGGKRGLILRYWKDTGVNNDLAARKAESIDLLVVDE